MYQILPGQNFSDSIFAILCGKKTVLIRLHFFTPHPRGKLSQLEIKFGRPDLKRCRDYALWFKIVPEIRDIRVIRGEKI
jgi:hypothetical protein